MKRLAVAGALALAACGTTPDATIVAAGPANDTNARPVARWEHGDEYHPPRATTTTTRAARSRPRPAPAPADRRAGGDVPRAYGVRLVSSTAYCLTGTMANGQRVYRGAVAMNGVPFGTRYRIIDGPLAGQVLTVADRIGHSSQFDIAMPGDCAAARRYGRRTITVEHVG